jgi:hypothetical protein
MSQPDMNSFDVAVFFRGKKHYLTRSGDLGYVL